MSKRIATLCAAVAATCSFSGAQVPGMATETASEPEMIRARFIHAVPDAPAFNVSHGPESLFQNVEYRQVTEMKTLPPAVEGEEREDRERRLILTPIGEGQPIQTDRAQVFEDTKEDYTVLASPTQDGTEVEITVYKVRRPAADEAQAQITLVNAARDTRGLDLYVNDKKVVSGADYQKHKGAEKIEAGQHTVSVRMGEDKVVIQPQAVSMAPGGSYTVFVVGTTVTGLEAVVVDDARGAAGQPGAGQPGAAGAFGTGATDRMTTGPQDKAMQGLEQTSQGTGPGTGPAQGESAATPRPPMNGDQVTTPPSM